MDSIVQFWCSFHKERLDMDYINHSTFQVDCVNAEFFKNTDRYIKLCETTCLMGLIYIKKETVLSEQTMRNNVFS